MEELDYSVFLAYWGAKYLIATFGIWLSIHIMMTAARTAPPHWYDDRPWLHRHPLVMIVLLCFADVAILYLFNNLNAIDQQKYYAMLITGAPILYTWTALVAIASSATIAYYAYRRRLPIIAGALSALSITLLALTAPYYIPF